MLKKLFGLLEDEKKLQPGEWETIGTRFFGEEDFDNVPHWIQKRIRRIDIEGLGESPQELTFEITGRTFIYRLDFDGPDGDILGVYRILKSPQAKEPGKKSIPPPAWRLIGKSITGGFGFNDSVHFSRVPPWVQEKIVEFKSGTVVKSVYRLKGRKFRYKIVFDYKGQGVLVTEVYRRPRTWFWKKLKAKS